MILRLLWFGLGPLMSVLSDAVPAAPTTSPTITVPWPSWLPWWPVELTASMVLVSGLAFVFLKLVRWVYSLVPFVQ